MNINRTVVQAKIQALSKIMAVATAFVLPLSTTLTNIFFIVAAILTLSSGKLREKISLILNNRIALLLLAFFTLSLIGISYTTAPMDGAWWMVGKYHKLLFAALLMPLFVEEPVRHKALQAFIVAMIIVLFCSYLKAFGWIHYDPESGPVEIFRGHIAFNFLLAFTAYLLLGKIFTARTHFCRWGWIILWLLFVFDAIFLCTGRSGYVILVSLTLLFFLQRLSWKGLTMAKLCGKNMTP